MKNYFILTIAALLLLASCSSHKANGNGAAEASGAVDSLVSDYTANVAGIQAKKRELLAIDDNDVCFWFSGDTEFQSQDPHAYWLMNRMMQMVQYVRTADDGWAWMLAMNESIGEYNGRLGRKIGSVNAATNAIEELIDIYYCGTQSEINTACYVGSILEHFKTLNAYYDFIESIDDYKQDSDWDVQSKALYYREFKEWFDLNNAVNGIMYFYTYAAARYSALPMDINSTFERWSKERHCELQYESGIYSSFDWQPFQSNANTISTQKFEELLSYIKSKTQNDVVEEVNSELDDMGYTHERVDGQFDFCKIAEMVGYYETALNNWREVRKQIALMLPKEKRKSYREITRQMHTRLYNDLSDLKDVRY